MYFCIHISQLQLHLFPWTSTISLSTWGRKPPCGGWRCLSCEDPCDPSLYPCSFWFPAKKLSVLPSNGRHLSGCQNCYTTRVRVVSLDVWQGRQTLNQTHIFSKKKKGKNHHCLLGARIITFLHTCWLEKWWSSPKPIPHTLCHGTPGDPTLDGNATRPHGQKFIRNQARWSLQ